MSKKIVKARKPFEEALHGLLYDLFRSAGVGLSTMQIEQVRDTARRLADLIHAETKLANIEQLKRFQKPIVEAFEKFQEELDKKAEHGHEHTTLQRFHDSKTIVLPEGE